MLNTDVLKGLLTDPELRQQVLRMVKQKFEADASTFEANAYLVRQLVNLSASRETELRQPVLCAM